MREIQYWLENKGSYDDGRALYEKYGASSFMKSMFAQGDTVYNRPKLREALEALLQQDAPEQLSNETPQLFEKKAKASPLSPERDGQRITPPLFPPQRGKSSQRDSGNITPRPPKGGDADQEDPEEDELMIASLSKPFSAYPEAVKNAIKNAISLYNQAGKMHRELRINKVIVPGTDEWRWPYLTSHERKMNALRILELLEESKKEWHKVDYYETTGKQLLGGPEKIQLPEGAFELEKLRQNLSSNVSKWKKKLAAADSQERKAIAEKQLGKYQLELLQVEEKLKSMKG